MNEQDQTAIELMYLAYRTFTSEPDAILEKLGLNRSHHRILYFIGKTKGLSVGELLSTLAISKQALNTPLRQLVAMGLVSNEKSEHDGRVRVLCLTEQGRILERQLTQSQTTLFQQVFEQLDPDARQSWEQVMRAMLR